VSRLHRRIRPAGAAPAVPDCSAAKTFYDWNGDGCGDIRGTTERIEYLSDLGGHLPVVDAVLSDCPCKDDGYDITDVVIQSGSRNGGRDGACRKATAERSRLCESA